MRGDILLASLFGDSIMKIMKKIIIIIYVVATAATGICALTLHDIVNVGAESLLPIAVLAYELVLGLLLGFRVLFLHRNKLKTRTLLDSDFKFSKDKSGNGSFDLVDRDIKKVRISDRNSQILSSVLLIGGALTIPFIFLFPLDVKLIASVILISVAIASIYLIGVISNAIEMKRAVAELKEKEAREQKELEEQKKREEMGYFK